MDWESLYCPNRGCRYYGRPFLQGHLVKNGRPTVSPAKNSLVYFISIVYIDPPVWRSPREEEKRGPPSGPRLTREEGAMRSFLLPSAPPGLSRIAGGV